MQHHSGDPQPSVRGMQKSGMVLTGSDASPNEGAMVLSPVRQVLPAVPPRLLSPAPGQQHWVLLGSCLRSWGLIALQKAFLTSLFHKKQ